MAQSHVRASTQWQKDVQLARVARILEIPTAYAYGMTTALSGALMERYKSGDVRLLSNDEIERSAGWEGEKGAFASAILDNYVDGRGVILRWSEVAEPILKEREANLNRVTRFRERMRQAQDEKVDDFITKGSGVNGAKPLDSASPSASPAPNADTADIPRKATAKKSTRTVGTDVEKPHATAPGVRVSAPPPPATVPPTNVPPKIPKSQLAVMRDKGPVMQPSEGSMISYLANHAPDSPLAEFVMGDSVMGDAAPLQSPLQSALRNALHSRAVVQDLEPETGSSQEQRSNPTDHLVPATFILERARVTARLSVVVAMMLGIPVEGVAERDDLVAMYGEGVNTMWKTVGLFLAKFYEQDSENRLVQILNEMILCMTPEGLWTPSGAKVAHVTGRALASVLEETTRKPPQHFSAAWAYTLRKLESGRANLALGKDGLTDTERASERQKREERVIAPEVRRVMDGMVGPWRRRSVTGKADEERTALRWMLGNDALKLELAELCEKTFASWRQDLPNLETVKNNWVKQEALKRWRAAGRPLPLPPR